MTNKDWAATVVADEGGYMVGYAYRDVPGYQPTTYVFATEEHARACAKSINESRGLSSTDVVDIVCSSFQRCP